MNSPLIQRWAAVLIFMSCVFLSHNAWPQSDSGNDRIAPGEIQLHGIVKTVDARRAQCIMLVDYYTLANGKSAAVNPSRSKTVMVDARTLWKTPSAVIQAALEAVQPGMHLTAYGPDSGSGAPLRARLIVLLDMAGATVKAPSAPATVSSPPAPDPPGPRTKIAVDDLHDLTEDNATRWTGFPTEKTTTELKAETGRVRAGRSSLKFVTQSGFDTGVKLTASGGNWDVSTFRYLRFWIWAENENENGFQGPQPVVILRSAQGQWKYVPRDTSLARGSWQQFYVPLTGDFAAGEWERTTEGAPSLAAVTSLEIHGDTWGEGFTWYLDGVSFISPRSIPAPVGDMAEGNATAWETFARQKATSTLADDTQMVRSGDASLRFTAGTRGECGVQFSANAKAADDATWDASKRKYLTFWARAETPGDQRSTAPVVILGGLGGEWRYECTLKRVLDRQWCQYWVPLAGGENWKRTAHGTPDLREITRLQIVQRPQEELSAFFYDGVSFMDEPELPATPAPPPGVNPLVIEPRVLLVIYDPILRQPRKFAGMRVHEAFKWGDPVDMANQIASDIRLRTHDLVRFHLAQMVVAEGYPPYSEGFTYDDLSYVKNMELPREKRQNRAMLFDYDRFIKDNHLIERVADGDIDEVWIYGGVDISGRWEACMAGRGAYFINGPTYKAGDKAFAIMGLNDEAGLANAMHSFGHRIESTMRYVYGRWEHDQADNWSRFALINKDAPGLGGVGSIHYPVNALSDYQYDSNEVVESNADDWYNYPNFKGTTRRINRKEWSPNLEDPHRSYMHWWFDHIPHFNGVGPDGFLCNWWRYVYDHDQFKNGNGNLKNAKNIPVVRITSPAGKIPAADMLTVRVDAGVDGALGRVDLYVDGQYRSTDTIAPFVFRWNAEGQHGQHTLVAKAYELVRGGEAVSKPVEITIE